KTSSETINPPPRSSKAAPTQGCRN
ncbi:uncharacterized protein METZ01_LOCUS230011, partial [marine metagenome]